jgi:hypothetical protein
MKTLATIVAAALCTSATTLGADFTAGNLVVLQVGDGSTLLTSTGAPIFVHEYSTAGTLVQTITVPVPPSQNGATGITAQGNISSEGHILRSVDGRYATFTGYAAVVGATTPASDAASVTNRVVARLDWAGTLDATTRLADAYNAGNIRSGITTDGTVFYIGGTGTSGNGVRYVSALGASTTTALQTTNTNTRIVGIFNGQLYYTTSSSPNWGVVALGTGIPTSGPNTPVILNGFPIATGPSSYGFAMSSDGNTIYVADDRAVASGGGVQKWVLSSGTWSLVYTLNTSLTSGCRALTVDWSGTNPIIYATDASTLTKLVTVTDAGSSSAFTTLATAATNTAFRGVAFAPTSDGALPIQLASFSGTAISNNAVRLNWMTVSEINNYGFFVQRRHASEQTFSELPNSFIPGHGTTLVPQHYTFTDNAAVAGHWFYRLKQVDLDGRTSFTDPIEVDVLTGVPEVVPIEFSLYQNYPNPFNPSTEIKFSVEANGPTTLTIYNVLGQEVSTLFKDIAEAGRYYRVKLDASNFASGMYFYMLESGQRIEMKKMLLLK